VTECLKALFTALMPPWLRSGPDALAERHPYLLVVTLSAWGATGPWAARRGFDSLVPCPTGIAVAEGADGKPGALPAQVLDHATGYLAAAAALLALAGVALGEPPGRCGCRLRRPRIGSPARGPVHARRSVSLARKTTW
jgi:CoA transferase family III